MDELADLKTSFASDMARWLNMDATGDVVASNELVPKQPVDQRIADDYLIQLALSGRVSPAAFVGPSLTDTAQQNVLNQVVEHCSVEVIDQGVYWLMSQAKRTELIRQLIAAGTLPERLNGLLPGTDRFGNMLRVLLRNGADIDLAKLSPDDLLSLMEAMETTKPLGVLQPDWAQVRRQISLNGFLSDQHTLLAGGFVGRKDELTTLRTFLMEEATPTTLAWKGLAITGLGGSGKSTLLAKFTEEVVRDQLATLIVFDFDRPGLNPDDRFWLESEMARQVGCQYPAVSELLRELRAVSRQQKASMGSTGHSSDSESISLERSTGLLTVIRAALEQEKAQQRPLLLVFDTFEEVDQQDLTESMLSWLRELAEQFWNFRLRVIFSGRLFDGALQQVLVATNQQSLDLGELSGAETYTLLKGHNVSHELARRVARSTLIPHRPLELRLLARMLVEKGDATLDEIESELRNGGEAAKSMFTGLVYRRVLLRITDPIAQQLAYPGLVLRYVTADLIEHVLAPVLKLKLSKSQVQVALQTLANHSWICYRGSNDEVWHRKDLRRSILSAMRAQEPDRARQISEAAFAYFSRVDSAKTDTRLQAEQTYHRLLWLDHPDEGAGYDLPTLKNAAEFIGADVVDLPKAAAVLLQYAQKGRVSAEDVALLPAEYLQKAYQRTGQRLVDNREFGKALRLYERQQTVGPDYQQEGVHQPWELDMLFTTVRWKILDQALTQRQYQVNSKIIDFISNDLYFSALIGLYKVFEAISDKELMLLASYLETNKRTGKDAQQVLKRVVMYYTLLNNTEIGQSDWQRRIILKFAKAATKTGGTVSSAHLQRKLVYIDLMAGQRVEANLSLAPSLLKIDPVWLSGLVTQPFIAEQPGEQGKALRQLLLDARALLTRKTVRRTLDALDVLYKNRPDWAVQGAVADYIREGQELMHWFRGPDSEFRDPIRFALLDAFCTRDQYRQLAGLLSSVLALPFTDLEPDAFADAMIPDPEHFLEPYIEIVDRTWALGPLLNKVAAVRPDVASLARVKAAYDRWDAAVTATFSAYSPS